MKKIIQILMHILYIELIVCFCYLSFQPGEASGGLSLSIANFIKNLFNSNIDIEIIHKLIRKLIGHFGYFIFLGIVSYFVYLTYKKRILFIAHYLVGLLLAIISEFVFQAISVGRGPSIIDCLIDYSGFILGSLICFTLIKLIRSKKI